MENFDQEKWAPFPEDNVTVEEFEVNVCKLKLLGKLQEIKGLHSNSFSERTKAVYDFAGSIHKVIVATGKDVELPIVVPGEFKKIGRDAAGFFRRVDIDLDLDGQSYPSMTFIATVNGITISLLKDTPVPQVMLSISLPEVEMNYLILVGQSLSPYQFLNSVPGEILDPEPLAILEKMLISASGALSSATKI